MNEAGLNNEQATKTLAVFTNYLKAKFPKALHQEIDSVMNDGSFGDAFKGNLTADWRLINCNLEQPSNLYERITGKKHVLTNEKIFETPSTWTFVQINDIFNFIDYRGKTPQKLKSGIRLVTAKNVKNGFLSL